MSDPTPRDKFTEKYSGHYYDYLKMMHARRFSPCELCGNTGAARCRNLLACPDTKWAPVAKGVRVFDPVKLGGPTGEMVASTHYHRCRCDAGGQEIMRKIAIAAQEQRERA